MAVVVGAVQQAWGPWRLRTASVQMVVVRVASCRLWAAVCRDVEWSRSEQMLWSKEAMVSGHS